MKALAYLKAQLKFSQGEGAGVSQSAAEISQIESAGVSQGAVEISQIESAGVSQGAVEISQVESAGVSQGAVEISQVESAGNSRKFKNASKYSGSKFLQPENFGGENNCDSFIIYGTQMIRKIRSLKNAAGIPTVNS